MKSEPTDRYGLTDTEWAVAEILHRGCWCEAEQDLYAEEGMTYGGCGPWSRGGQAREILAAIDGPEPTWRDVIRAAQAAGWTGRGGASWRMWGAWNGEDVNDTHGWMIRHQFLRTVKITVVGPGTGHMASRSYTELMNPTPAQVLAAARLVNLINDKEPTP